MKITFKEKRKEAQNAYSLIFSADKDLKWKAGEYLVVNLPHENTDNRGDERFFSISAAPSEDVVMITTRYFGQKASSFKQRLFKLKKEEEIKVSKPENSDSFFNANDHTRQYIFLTAGIGITPVRSVIKEYHLNNRDLQGTLLYANRDNEYIFGEELENMVKDMPSFTIQKYHDKRIGEDTLRELLNVYTNPVFNISGTYKFTTEMKDILLNQLAVNKNNVKTSSFGKNYYSS